MIEAPGKAAPWHDSALSVGSCFRINDYIWIFYYDSLMTRRRAPTPATAPPPRTDRLRVRHLRLLDAIRRAGSLGAAARELRVSQPAVTLLLQEVERAFGAILVTRDRRGARLTVAGLRAHERLAIALASLERAVAAVRESPGEPPLRVGTVQLAGVRALPLAFATLERSGLPDRVELREGRARDLVADLCAGTLDCVIGWMDESLADAASAAPLSIEPLWQGRMQIVAAARHPLARSRSVHMAELERWRWIVPRPQSRTHEAFVRLFLNNGRIPPPVAVECSAVHTAMHIVAATRLLAVAPDDVVERYAKLGSIAVLRGAALDLGRSPVTVITRRDSDGLPALARFRRALAKAAR